MREPINCRQAPVDRERKYQTDGDKLRLLTEAVDAPELTDGAFRMLVRSLVVPSRIDDSTWEWAQGVADEIVKGKVSPEIG